MKKYEHEYVSLYLPSVCSFGKFEEHKEIINSYGEKGWRYCGYIPISEGGHGKTYQIDLIFEKETE